MALQKSRPLNPNAEEWYPPVKMSVLANRYPSFEFRGTFFVLVQIPRQPKHHDLYKVSPVFPRKKCYRKTMTGKRKIWVSKKPARPCSDGNGAGGVFVGSPAEGTTTLMIRNIPNEYKRSVLVNFLDNLCCWENRKAENLGKDPLRIEYDFVYLPVDFVKRKNLGYAFVNFTTHSAAKWVWKMLEDQPWKVLQNYCGRRGRSSSGKVCQVDWARIQGKAQLVNRLEKSTFCCDEEEYLPVEFKPPRDGLAKAVEAITVGNCLGIAKGELIERMN